MPNIIKYTDDMVLGKRFGKLIAIGPIELIRNPKTGKGIRKVKCKCDCGNEKFMDIIQLCKGKVISCGCEKNNVLGRSRHLGLVKSKGNLKDGRKGTRLYSIWNNMNNRCMYPSCDNYKYYGGRGITVCYDWNRANKKYGWINFKNWAYMNGWNEYDKSLEIDRIDSNGNYEPDNCRFVTRIEQVSNKSDNVYLTYGGITKTQSQWSEALGLNIETIRRRIMNGWTDSEVISIPRLAASDNKDEYIKEHGIRPFIFINEPLYQAKYGQPFFDNEKLKTVLP